MQSNTYTSQQSTEQSYGAVLRELGNSAKDLIHNELTLLTAELKRSTTAASKHLGQAAAFGALMALSVFPFLAFLVIGLGELLDGRYWLSSLIVAIICAAVGGPMAYKSFKKIKEHDLNFTHTKSTLDRSMQTVQVKLDEVKDAARGERYETIQFQ